MEIERVLRFGLIIFCYLNLKFLGILQMSNVKVFLFFQKELDQSLPELCLFLLMTARSPVISLFMKTDFLFVGNLPHIIGKSAFIIWTNLFVARICVSLEDMGPPEELTVNTTQMMMMMVMMTAMMAMIINTQTRVVLGL